MKKVSFVLPLYNEQEVIEVFHSTLLAECELHEYEYNFIYVNDGSTDSSLEKLLEIRALDGRVTVLNFSRNFGHEMAITAGLDFANEMNVDAVCIMDTDLQDPPHVALSMIERWNEGVDVVYAQRRRRSSESIIRKTLSHGFYWMLTAIAESNIPPHTSDFRVIDSKVLKSVVKYREQSRYIRGIISDTGYTQEAYLFDRAERYAGESHYNLKKLVSLAFEAIFGFSTAPLRLISKVGLFISMLALLYGGFAVFQKFFMPEIVRLPGYTFLIVVILGLSGVQMLMLGAISSYVGRIFREVQGRPLYLMESISHTPQPTTNGKD